MMLLKQAETKLKKSKSKKAAPFHLGSAGEEESYTFQIINR
jgi:hypothetical protein